MTEAALEVEIEIVMIEEESTEAGAEATKRAIIRTEIPREEIKNLKIGNGIN